jgi:hypothetical protein
MSDRVDCLAQTLERRLRAADAAHNGAPSGK